MGAELAFGAPFDEVGHERALRLRLTFEPRTPEHAADIAAAQQHQIERQFRNFSGGKADHQITAEPGHRAHRRFGVRAADRVIDHINAVLAAEPPQRVA